MELQESRYLVEGQYESDAYEYIRMADANVEQMNVARYIR